MDQAIQFRVIVRPSEQLLDFGQKRGREEVALAQGPACVGLRAGMMAAQGVISKDCHDLWAHMAPVQCRKLGLQVLANGKRRLAKVD